MCLNVGNDWFIFKIQQWINDLIENTSLCSIPKNEAMWDILKKIFFYKISDCCKLFQAA